jgi:hypothetical protein
MKRNVIILLVVLAVVSSFAAVNAGPVGCTYGGTWPDSVIVCDGTNWGVDAGNGNDTITNNGTMNYEMNGQRDNDTLINNGTVNGDMDGNFNNDTVTNNGTVNGDMLGGSGSDIVTNNGTVNGEVIGGSGSDTVTNSGSAETVRGGSGDDTVNLFGEWYVEQYVSGGSNTDTLNVEATACDINAVLAQLRAAQGSETNTVISFGNDDRLTVREFETINGILSSAGCPRLDMRINLDANLGASPVALYCTLEAEGAMLDIYQITAAGQGTLMARIPASQLTAAQAQALSSASEVSLYAQNNVVLVAQADGMLRLSAPELADASKQYTFVFAGVEFCA